MHVLITADTIGGVWTYVRELVSGLSRRGVRTTLVSFGEIPASTQIAWMERLQYFDYRPTAFRLEWMQDAAADVKASSEYLCSIVREVEPDVLHLNQYCYGNIDVDIPRVVVAHSDVVSWWMAVHGEEPSTSKWIDWYRETVTSGLMGAYKVIVPSQWMASILHGIYGVPETNCFVIYNGRDPQLFNPFVTKEQFVLTVGRIWDVGKQISMLNGVSSVPVYVAGAAEEPGTNVRTKIATSALHMKGQQNEEQLRNLYARAAIYAATSRYEPFGLALVEAAFSRCAIIANDIPSFRELWGDAVCYFQSNSPQNLGERIEWLSKDDLARKRFAQHGYEHAMRHFTAERMVEQYMELYRSLITAETAAA